MIKLRRAIASEAKPLVGLYSPSGNGKTYSALLLALGYAGSMEHVVMVETESGRGEAYANDPRVGGYSVLSLREDFAPKRYGEAIAEAERAQASVLIVDSGSHEWEGLGGVLAMAAKNQEDGRKGPLVWQRPKIEHQREFIARLLQTPIPLVVACLRAKYPMVEATIKDVQQWEAAGKPGGEKARPKIGEWYRSFKLEPKQSEDFLFECFVHGYLDEAHALHVTKYTLDADMRAVFPDGEPITQDTGKRLAAWAARNAHTPQGNAHGEDFGAPEEREDGAELINTDQKFILESQARDRGVPIERLLAKAKIARLAELPAEDYLRALAWLDRQPRTGLPPSPNAL